MDTATQFLKQNQKQPVQNGVTQPVQPVQPPNIPQVQPAVPITPVGSAQKEAGPLAKAPVGEYVKPTEQAPQLDEEVAGAGVKTVENPEVPKLHPDVKHTGLAVSGEPMQLQHMQTSPQTTIPFTQAQILADEKISPTEGKKWLAYIYEVIAKRLGLWRVEKKGAER